MVGVDVTSPLGKDRRSPSLCLPPHALRRPRDTRVQERLSSGGGRGGAQPPPLLRHMHAVHSL